MHRWITILSAVLIIILGFSVYANSIGGKFLWDDDWLIKNNLYIRDLSKALHIFSENRWTDTARRFHFYRPIQIFTYMLDYSIWKLDVRGYHITNIFLHTITALCLFSLIQLLYGNRLLSCLTGIFFIIHPVHTEAVSYMSGRADPLASFFILLAIVCYVKSIATNSKLWYGISNLVPLKIAKELSPKAIFWYSVALASYTVALFSRESSLVLPLLLLLYHYTFRKEIVLKKFVPIIVISFFYVVLRYTVSRELLPTYGQDSVSLLERIPGIFAAIANYIRLLFLPFGLHMEYGNMVFDMIDPKVIAGIFITAFLIVYAFKTRNNDKLTFFSISWFFITLLPQSNIYPLRAYMAEHWLYLPSMGFIIILAKALSSLYRNKRLRLIFVSLVIILIVFYSSLTIRQNSYWKDPLSFYQKTLKYSQDNALLYYNLANEYRASGRKEEAAGLYRKAIELDSDNAEAYNNLGTVYFDMGKKYEAIYCYKKAIAITPDFSYPYCNLANTYDSLGALDEAAAAYNKAISVEPKNKLAHANLGIVYFKQGKYDNALAHYSIARDLGYGVDEEFLKLIRLKIREPK